MQTRRLFLRRSAIAMAGLGAAPAWLTRTALAAENPRKNVLVVIFQRGAVDGLNVVVPYGEKQYYELRPNLAVARDSILDLNGFFGLNPALAPLKPIYDAKQMAVIHASGSPDPTRSHFDAQDYMESGTPGRKATSDGWLNRALPSAGPTSPVRAVSLGTALPRALRGHNEAVAIANLNDFQVRDPRSSQSFEDMYAETLDQVLQGTGRETFEAVKLIDSMKKQAYTPANGARYPGAKLGQSLQQIARLIKAGVGLEVAFADMGGWDTHVNETPQLTNLLTQFGQSLAAFAQDMGDRMEDVTVVTMSEFGRTAKENGSRGTDHGHGNVMLVFGGGVRGGIKGDWPGLGSGDLYEGRDLAVTTDFRDVLGEVIRTRLGTRDLAQVFPGHKVGKSRGIFS